MSGRERFGRRELGILAAITGLAAVLRLVTLDLQSLWLDEALSAQMVRDDLGALFDALPYEASPPLFYLVEFVWTHLFGDSEFAFRLPSALAGIVTVPVIYLAARELGGRRAGVVGGVLAAVSPAFIWYSQEGRTYSLAIMFAALSVLFFARSLRGDSGQPLLWWAVFSAGAIATHYFAVMLVGIEAAWMLYERRDRRRVLAFAAIPVLAGVALIPLLMAQQDNGAGSFVKSFSFASRVKGVPTEFLLGFSSPAFAGATAIALALAAVAVFLLATEPRGDSRRLAFTVAGVGIATCALPILLALAGRDYLYPRNLLVAWVPLMVALAVGLAAQRTRLGIAVTAGFVAVGLATVISVAAKPELQRDDWRSGLEQIGPPSEPRLLVVRPFYDRAPVLYYAPTARLALGALAVDEIRVVQMSEPDSAPRAPAGYRLAGVDRGDEFTSYDYRSDRPRRVRPAEVADGFGVRTGGVLVEEPGAKRGRFVHPNEE